MKPLYFLPAFATLFFLVSCSSLKVVQDYDKSVDFSQYKTFSFAKLEADKTSISDLNLRRITTAITNELGKKGLAQADQGDLEVHVHALVKSKQTASATTDYYGYGYYRRGFGWGTPGYATTSVTVEEYREGTLIIDLVDNPKDQLVWQGIGTKTLAENPDKAEQRINEAVSKILKDFPPSN